MSTCDIYNITNLSSGNDTRKIPCHRWVYDKAERADSVVSEVILFFYNSISSKYCPPFYSNEYSSLALPHRCPKMKYNLKHLSKYTEIVHSFLNILYKLIAIRAYFSIF